MPPKPKQRPTRSRKNNLDGARLHVKCNKSFAAPAAVYMGFLTLDQEATNYGIPAYSETAKAYFDMYRYFRITRLSVRVAQIGAAPSVPGGAATIAYLAPGVTTNPTNCEDFETPHQELTTNDPALYGELIMSARDFNGIGSWCVTQGDATDDIFTSFGEVWLSTIGTGTTNYLSAMFVGVMIYLDLHLEFKTLLDPATISALVHQSNQRNQIVKKTPFQVGELHPARIDGTRSARICADDCPCPHCQKP